MNDSLLRKLVYLTETSYHRLNKNLESQSSVNLQLRILHVVTKKKSNLILEIFSSPLIKKNVEHLQLTWNFSKGTVVKQTSKPQI